MLKLKNEKIKLPQKDENGKMPSLLKLILTIIGSIITVLLIGYIALLVYNYFALVILDVKYNNFSLLTLIPLALALLFGTLLFKALKEFLGEFFKKE